nr:hypothetical protein CFP56_55632 [Quercus suber]
MVHDSISSPGNIIWGNALRMVKDYRVAVGTQARFLEPKGSSLEQLQEDYFLINVDGAIPTGYGHSGIGILIRDKRLRFIAAMCKPLSGRLGVEETEAIAMEQGLVLAKMLGLERVLVVGDSLQTVQAIVKEEVRGAVGHLVAGIVQEMRNFADVKVRHIARTGNKIAHVLAQHAKAEKNAMCWVGSEPGIITDLIRYEELSL